MKAGILVAALFLSSWAGLHGLSRDPRPRLNATFEFENPIVSVEHPIATHILLMHNHVLSGYLEQAALTWMTLPKGDSARAKYEEQEGESADATKARMHEVATQIADLLTYGYQLRDPDTGRLKYEPEPPAGIDLDTKTLVSRTGLIVMSLAFHEGHFSKYVDDGRCNDPVWRASLIGKKTMLRWGTCDNSLAYSIFQIHPEHGVHVYWGAGFSEWGFDPVRGQDGEEVVVTGQEMIADRSEAVLVALHMVRQSIRAGTGLCRYAGEFYIHTWDDGVGCPKAELRMKLATDYATAHPF
jgi:hypothetical protein